MPDIILTLTDAQLQTIDWRAGTLGITRDVYIKSKLADSLKDLKALFDTSHASEAAELYRRLSVEQKATVLAQLKALV